MDANLDATTRIGWLYGLIRAWGLMVNETDPVHMLEHRWRVSDYLGAAIETALAAGDTDLVDEFVFLREITFQISSMAVDVLKEECGIRCREGAA